MGIEVVVPRLGWSMDEGTFCEWLKADGEYVNRGETLFVIEGDKSAQEIECFDSGYLRIPPDAPKPGDAVVVGQLLAYLGDEDDLEPWNAEKTDKNAVVATGRESGVSVPVNLSRTETLASDAVLTDWRAAGTVIQKVTPRARRLARELGVDLSRVRGTGREGRIRELDVRGVSAVGDHERVSTTQLQLENLHGRLIPITPVRRTIAKRMVAGVRDTAPVTLTTKADATEIVARRARFNAESQSSSTLIPSYTDLFIKLTAIALEQHPMLNAQWRENGIFVPSEIRVGFAVDTNAGLMVPVIESAAKLGIFQIAERTEILIQKAREHTLRGEEILGTFTISNLGHLGIDAFTPIINLPQCAILGLGRIVREPVAVGDEVQVRERITLSLTFDHRIVDGAPAARFLGTVRGLIENPSRWLGE